MINHEAIQLALRVKLATVSVATTGSVSLEATTTAYVRTTGSFITDGFAVGMEVVGAGFTASENNAAKTVTAVSALTLNCTGNIAEAAASRTLTVGEPEDVVSENIRLEPATGKPYFEENYLPGPMDAVSLGATAELEVLPTYVVKVFVPANVGILALRRYSDTLLTLFAPGTELTVANHTVRVRRDVSPFSGQILPVDGFALCVVTVPLRVRTANAI